MPEDNQYPDGQPLLLSDLLALLWRRRAVVIEFAVGAMILMTAVLFIMEPKYRVTATVVERRDETTQAQGLGLSNLSSIGGALLGGRAPLTANFQQFLNLLTEPGMLEHLPDRDAILHTVFKKEWDLRNRSWIRSNGPLTLLNMLFGLPRKPTPDVRKLSEYLKKELVVEPIDSGPLYEIAIDQPDPIFGVQLLTSLMNGADGILRTRRATELKVRETYLLSKLERTTGVEERQALAGIISQTILSEATLYQTPTYAISIVQQATASPFPVSPLPVLYLLFAAIGGSVAGCAAIFVGVLTSGTHPHEYGRQPRKLSVQSLARFISVNVLRK